MTGIYDFTASTITGEEKTLADFKGKVVLIVNTASKCGFTPQYNGLEALYKQYHDQGLEILGFPCNQFAKQESGTDAEIHAFCSKNFGVSFPLFAKVEVNGDDAHPLFKYLKDQAPGVFGSKGIKWNFTKFLVDRNGKVISRYAPTTTPDALARDIKKFLG